MSFRENVWEKFILCWRLLYHPIYFLIKLLPVTGKVHFRQKIRQVAIWHDAYGETSIRYRFGECQSIYLQIKLIREQLIPVENEMKNMKERTRKKSWEDKESMEIMTKIRRNKTLLSDWNRFGRWNFLKNLSRFSRRKAKLNFYDFQFASNMLTVPTHCKFHVCSISHIVGTNVKKCSSLKQNVAKLYSLSVYWARDESSLE